MIARISERMGYLRNDAQEFFGIPSFQDLILRNLRNVSLINLLKKYKAKTTSDFKLSHKSNV